MSMVKARAIAQAFDSTAGRLYFPGDTVEIDPAGPLASLKTPMGKWVFDFPRQDQPAPGPVAPSDVEKEVARLKSENAELAKSSSGPSARR